MKERVENTSENKRAFQIVAMYQMKQRSVVIFLRLKGLLKKIIHHELLAVLEENVASSSSVTRFCREAILGLKSEEASSSHKDHGLDEVNESIPMALSDELFSSVRSVRQIARRTCVSKGIVFHWLVDSLHFTVGHQTSDIFIGLLTSSPIVRRQVKSLRVELSIQLRDLLLSIRHQGQDRIQIYS
jgi:hypothetical protein